MKKSTITLLKEKKKKKNHQRMSGGKNPTTIKKQLHALQMKEMESISFTFWKQIQNIWKCNLPFAKYSSGQNSPLEASSEWINLGCFTGVVLSMWISMCKKSTVNNTTPLSKVRASPSSAQGKEAALEILHKTLWLVP